MVRLSRDGDSRTAPVHRLVLEAFEGPPPEGCEPNHIDGDKGNNALDNLEWVTHSQNVQHAYDTGLNDPEKHALPGETHHQAKLTREQVLEIRRRYRESGEKFTGGDVTMAELAEEYGVSLATISNVINRRSWAHV